MKVADLPPAMDVFVSTSTNGPKRRVHTFGDCSYVLGFEMNEKTALMCFDDWEVCGDCEERLNAMTEFITETLEEIEETRIAHCRLCPEGDDEIDVSDCEGWGDVLERIAEHGIDAHGLPEGEPWTDEVLEAAKERSGREDHDGA